MRSQWLRWQSAEYLLNISFNSKISAFRRNPCEVNQFYIGLPFLTKCKVRSLPVFEPNDHNHYARTPACVHRQLKTWHCLWDLPLWHFLLDLIFDLMATITQRTRKNEIRNGVKTLKKSMFDSNWFEFISSMIVRDNAWKLVPNYCPIDGSLETQVV